MQPEPSRRPQTQPPPPDPVAEVWRCRSKKLSAPDKRAFEFLFRLTEGGTRAMLVAPADVGNDQGTSSDAGKDRLDNLHEHGFFAIQPWGKKGNYKAELADWNGALRALGQRDERPLLDTLENQHQNTSQPASEARPFGAAAGVIGCGLSPADGGAAEDLPEHPPEDLPEHPRRPFLPSERTKTYSPPSTFANPSQLSGAPAIPKVSEGVRRGSSGGSSAANDEEAAYHQTLANRRREFSITPAEASLARPVLARLASLPSPEQQRQTAEQRAQEIFASVKCPRMRLAPCLRMAWHVVEGRVEWGPIKTLLDTCERLAAAGELGVPRSVYVNAGFDRICKRYGVPLPIRTNKPKPR